ncbi:hypothetical protein JK163_08390 [Levilactobacillus brevis]|uniref:hypothetical protein n=1 Tax=Levilactobacillus brevis TaxID=1580 RepID=UPI001BAA5805|nr:hypothetical protein [Levilactobacillus brevis]MBS1006309.1 hypothetical protein [Levilactobacillus brevis]MBS1013401.1 hypothetical protein [Levilactobacillus brevis]
MRKIVNTEAIYQNLPDKEIALISFGALAALIGETQEAENLLLKVLKCADNLADTTKYLVLTNLIALYISCSRWSDANKIQVQLEKFIRTADIGLAVEFVAKRNGILGSAIKNKMQLNETLSPDGAEQIETGYCFKNYNKLFLICNLEKWI